MDNGIRKVRESIKRRKKDRYLSENKSNKETPLFPSDEERHGFLTTSTSLTTNRKTDDVRKVSKIKTFRKVIGAIVLLSLCSFILQTNIVSFDTPKRWLLVQLEEEFPFAKVNQWYVSTFGSPIALTPEILPREDGQVSLPVIGDVVETFSTNGTGIMISPNAKSVVSALQDGVVIFAGNDKNTNKTVVIQHADDSKTTYGFLSDIDVYLYQVVHTNETIGVFQPTTMNETMFFSIEKNNEYIDPSKVIPVGDIP